MDAKNVEEIINSASLEAQRLIRKILVLEKEKLYMSKPHGIVNDIVSEFKKEIK
jgi:hypothetical protein